MNKHCNLWLCIVIVFLILSSCGQKGALYLPAPETEKHNET